MLLKMMKEFNLKWLKLKYLIGKIIKIVRLQNAQFVEVLSFISGLMDMGKNRNQHQRSKTGKTLKDSGINKIHQNRVSELLD